MPPRKRKASKTALDAKANKSTKIVTADGQQPEQLAQPEQSEMTQELGEPEEDEALQPPLKTRRLGRGVHRNWKQYTATPLTKQELAKNGRTVGRVLIPWTRKYSI